MTNYLRTSAWPYALACVAVHIVAWIILAQHLAAMDRGPKGDIPSLTFIVLGMIFVPSILIGSISIGVLGYRYEKASLRMYALVIPVVFFPIVACAASVWGYKT